MDRFQIISRSVRKRFPFPSWKLTINWPEVFPGLELHTIQRLVLFQWFLSNPFQISIGFKCFSWFHVISCWFMLCLDIYGWFIHRYSQFFGFKTRSDLFTDEFQQRPEDSRNGMIWIFDMPSGTCTSALSCHSQQVRCHGWQRSEEHTSELQSRFGISYAVFCLKKKKQKASGRATTDKKK